MTPLEIHLLLNLYHSYQPYNRYPAIERCAPAMHMAFAKFREHGLLCEGVTFISVMVEHEDHNEFLSAKGLLLVERLMEFQP